MSTSTEAAKPSEPSLAKDGMAIVRYYAARYLGGRRGLIILGLGAVVVGGALNWSWFIAIGVAPILIAAAPCLVMCALGLCMTQKGGSSCSTQSSPTAGNEVAKPSSTALDAETADEPAVAPPREAAVLRAAPLEDREEQAAAVVTPIRSEPMNERS